MTCPSQESRSFAASQAVIHTTRESGAIRHGAECFNFYFPQAWWFHLAAFRGGPNPPKTLNCKDPEIEGMPGFSMGDLQDVSRTDIGIGSCFTREIAEQPCV